MPSRHRSPRRPPSPSASFSSFLPPHLLHLPTPRFLVPSFRFSTPSPDEMGRSARARAHGTQLKVSHTGGHAVPRRDDRIDPSLRSQIPACRLFSAVLPSRSHRNRFAVADCPRSPHFASTNPRFLQLPVP